jgi:KUP system potassium uptake protein
MLIGLFIIQSLGSGSIGVYFGPIMLAWFSVIGVTGAVHLIPHPELLAAINPIYAADYLATHDVSRLLAVLGAVFLALTGAEALYADMGHFGRRAIRFDWFLLVFPALILNYFGQGALILSHPEGVDNPFFRLFPPWSLYLAVALATAATVIASQAVISGAYTLAQQAIQLGLLPRLNIEQTSKSEAGQIYVPQINWLLAAGVAGLVLGFGSSDALSSAYGIAVVTTMIATTILSLLVAHLRWQWGLLPLLGIGGIFLAVDLAFFGANILKIPQGGWFPLIVGALVFMLMMTWRRGRKLVLERLGEDNGPMSGLLKKLKGAKLARVEGTAVYLSARKDRVPSALALNLRHNKVLHDRVAILNVISERVPRVEECERLAVHPVGKGLFLITMRFGFAEKQNVMAAFESHRDLFSVDPKTTTFFVGRELPVPKVRPDLPFWQAVLYGFLTRNAVSVADYLEIPNENIVDLGTRIEL